jgi:hypothetical protein
LNKLQVNMQHQAQTNWCWAAVSSSVSAFFAGPLGPSGQPWQQCEIVNSALGETSCCQAGNTNQCNQDGYLDQALTIVSHLAAAIIAAPLSFAQIQQEIDAGHPIGVRIGWYGDGGHFVMISGYDDTGGAEIVDVDDPWYGPSSYQIAAFTSGYQSGNGQWTHTYPIA